MKINLVSWNIYDDFVGHSLSDTCQTVQTFSSYMSQVFLIKIAFLVEIIIINFLEYLDEIEVIRGILLQDQRIAEQKIILQNLDSEIRQISTQKVSWIVYCLCRRGSFRIFMKNFEIESLKILSNCYNFAILKILFH